MGVPPIWSHRKHQWMLPSSLSSFMCASVDAIHQEWVEIMLEVKQFFWWSQSKISPILDGSPIYWIGWRDNWDRKPWYSWENRKIQPVSDFWWRFPQEKAIQWSSKTWEKLFFKPHEHLKIHWVPLIFSMMVSWIILMGLMIDLWIKRSIYSKWNVWWDDGIMIPIKFQEPSRSMISPYETDRRTSAPATPNRQAAKERQETPPPPPQAEPEAIPRDAPSWPAHGNSMVNSLRFLLGKCAMSQNEGISMWLLWGRLN